MRMAAAVILDHRTQQKIGDAEDDRHAHRHQHHPLQIDRAHGHSSQQQGDDDQGPVKGDPGQIDRQGDRELLGFFISFHSQCQSSPQTGRRIENGQGLLIPQLGQALLAHPEKVGHLVNHGDFDLLLQLSPVLAHLFQGLLENVNRIGIQRRLGDGPLV